MTRQQIQVKKALDIARDYSRIDEKRLWVVDQMVRALTGEDYELWVKETEIGEDGLLTYKWETGIAP